MPEYGEFYGNEYYVHSLSQGHCKDYVGITSSIILLLLNSVSIGGTVVKKCGRNFFLSLVGLTHGIDSN
jgi:hypothetical protein